MTSRKKLLIVSCSGGLGHVRAALALQLSCQKFYPEIEVRHIDMAKHLHWSAYTYVVSSYQLSVRFFPLLYKLTYYLSDSWLTQKLCKTLSPLNRLLAQKFIAYITDYQPNFIISTHYLPQLILPKNFPGPIDTVITDYYPHKIWLAPKVRNFFVATEEIKNNLADIGITAVASGIPIHPDFLVPKDSVRLKNKLGIKNNWPIILLIQTPYEKIKIKEIVSEIVSQRKHKEINIIIINCKHDLTKLKNDGQTNIIAKQKVENMDEWMRVTDIVIGKAGGLTTTEAMYLQKPIIIINPTPGQEDYNTAYLQQNYYGIKAYSAKDVVLKIENILANPSSINKKSYPDASKIILQKVLS
jgi:processive 1,2-diacylglycerol beta-glucosyltransferase